jgi:uncharacterized protein YceH (UPF0502 family)
MSEGLPLNDLQVRILGCLIEKKANTPDQYPLTLNALKNACNQKSNRFPVCQYETGAIGHELRTLENLGYVRMERSARAERYEHRLSHALELKARDIAVLCPLLLRGPQTAAEIKARSYEVLGLDDTEAVIEVLERLSERETPLITLIPRQAGQREDRYMHLLAGEPDISQLPAPSASTGSATRSNANDELLRRVEQLEQELAELRTLVTTLQDEK